MKKDITKTKQKILDALEGIKQFDLSWVVEVTYFKTLKAKSEEEVREMFENGDIDVNNGDVNNEDFVQESLEIEEVQDGR